jgi:multidrug efflux pump
VTRSEAAWPIRSRERRLEPVGALHPAAVATVLLTIGLAMAGIAAFFVLPVSPLPQVDYPTISVSASLSGASPETMASSVATPLERRLGTISGVNEMTSQSSTGSTRVTLQFDLNRNIDGAAREVQAAINAARSRPAGDVEAAIPATARLNPSRRAGDHPGPDLGHQDPRPDL